VNRWAIRGESDGGVFYYIVSDRRTEWGFRWDRKARTEFHSYQEAYDVAFKVHKLPPETEIVRCTVGESFGVGETIEGDRRIRQTTLSFEDEPT
jgi:hypothetical protein